MSKDPSYPMYAQDFDMDTASWTVAEIGAYIRLLNYEWVNGALPNNVSHLARIARVDSRTMHKMWSTVIAKKFLTNGANMLVNRRMEEERGKRDKYHEIQREKGKAGADKRWHKDIAGAMPVLCPEHKPEDGFSFSLKDINTLVVSGANNGCPHQEIINLYHELCPMLPRVRQWTPKRQKQLKARWLSSKDYQDTEWWRDFFQYIAGKCPHLIGKNDRQWTADLEWICKEENFVKIVEGRYEK